jgi:putative membrane protein
MRTMKLMLGASLAAALLYGSPSFAQDKTSDKASQKFITEAIEGNLAEIQMGQLAQKNGNSDGVRSFGKMLEQDHSAANRKAIDVAKSMGVTPPTKPTSKQKQAYDRMSKMTGAKFDEQFAKDSVADHRKDIREFEKESKKNDAAGNFAKETLPTLQKHLDTAQSLTGSTTTGKR